MFLLAPQAVRISKLFFMDKIRNFSIIAHIDHGKSTLADRMLEVTKTLADRDMKQQVLDQMELERERGITIKMTPVTMNYRLEDDNYQLNLIDTPGHVDFSYEVSRALSAVEGAVLLVDATQGVEAQTLSVLQIARKLELVIVPAVTKIDARNAQPDKRAAELAGLLDISSDGVLRVSGKTGEGVENLLARLIKDVPAPTAGRVDYPRGLIFDFDYTPHRGVVAYTRVFSGSFSDNQNLRLLAADRDFQAAEVGVFAPEPQRRDELTTGSVGYVVTGIKEPGVVSIGDTITQKAAKAKPLPGYQPPQPVVWASLFPENQDEFETLKNALERLLLVDSSLQFERDKSPGLGQGYRVGFLGKLHMEITVERLRRDFGLDLITTSPSVAFKVTDDSGNTETIRTPAKFPHYGDVSSVEEPWTTLTLRTPARFISEIMSLIYDQNGEVLETETVGEGEFLNITAELPLRELMRGFFSRLKQVSSGFASLSYELADLRPADVVKLDILVADDVVPALSSIVARERLEASAREMVEKLYDLLDKQVVPVRIQARAEGRIIASETLAATRKDVTAGLYGGDYSRKKKQLKAQREGKKRLAEEVKVQIPSDVYVQMMREN